MKRLAFSLIMLLLPVLSQAGPIFTQPTPPSLAADPATCTTNGAWYQKFYYNTVSNQWKYCSATNTWSAFGGGSGTVTHTGGALTLNACALGNGAADIKASAVCSDDGTTLNYTGTGGGAFQTVSIGGSNPSVLTAIADPAAGLGKFWLSSTLTGRLKWSDATTLHTFVGADTTDTFTNKSMSEAQLTFTDITTGNVSTSNHGFTPKLDNVVTDFLNGQGGWSAPAAGVGFQVYKSGATLGATTAQSGLDVALGNTGVSIPGNTISTSQPCMTVNVGMVNSGANTATIKLNYGGTLAAGVVTGGSFYTMSGGNSTTQQANIVKICHTGATAQSVFMLSSTGSGVSLNAVGTMAVDDTATKNLFVTFNIGNNTNTMTGQGLLVTVP